MKRVFLLIASAALLFAGCQKEQIAQNVESDGDQVTVTFTAGLAPEGTKAVIDGDGAADNVNHWVLEVHDNHGLFYREPRTVTVGTLQQTYELKLFKNQSYTLLFWADTEGAYNTDDLTAVSTAGSVANKDSRDAFYANVPYTSLVSESKSVTLTRPFAQLNIITNDLAALKEEVVSTAYDNYAPKDLQVKVTVPTTFNVKTETFGEATEQTLTATASYGDFSAGAPETTLFMDYIFASTSKELKDMKFSFKSNDNEISYDFTNIPLQRNYRTNIKGQLMSNDSEWTVVIDPIWTGEQDINYVTAGSIEAANEALESGKTNILIENPADFNTHVVFPETVEGKDITITVSGAEGKTIYFENGPTTKAIAACDGPANLNIVADVQNLNINCPKTDVSLQLGAGNTDFPVVKAKSLTIGGVTGTVLKTAATPISLECKVDIHDVEIALNPANTDLNGAINTTKSSDFTNVVFTGSSKKILVLGGEGTIMNITGCTFANQGNGRAIMGWAGSPQINIDGCSFDNTYPFNVDGGSPVFTVTNSTLNGWTSYTTTATVSFEGCSFGKSTSGYAFCRPYSSTTFTSCDFSSDFLVDFGASGITITMTECTVGGATAVTKAILEPDLQCKDGILIIDGSTVYPAYTTDASGNYHVATKDGLFTIAADMNTSLSSFYNKTIYIEKDIDLENTAWTPIQGSQSGDYAITFDGQNHKISNVSVSDVAEDGGAGFFGHWAGTITNLNLDGVKIENTINWSGALCGYFSTGTISNVSVSNVLITNLNETKCKRNGGLCGFVNASTNFTNVALSGVAITGTEQLGGFIGSLQADGPATYYFTDCSVADIQIVKVGTKSVTSFGTKTGGHAPAATINGDITVSGTNTLPEGSPEDGWGVNSL